MCLFLKGPFNWIIILVVLGKIDSSIVRYRHFKNIENREILCPKLTLTFPASNLTSPNSTEKVTCNEARQGVRCYLRCNSHDGLTCAKVWDNTRGMYLAMWIGNIGSCKDVKLDNMKLREGALMNDDLKVFKLAQQSQKTCDMLQVDSTQVTGSCPSGKIGTVCFFTCRTNFYPTTGNGQFKLTCIDDPNEQLGYWSGAIPNCKRVMCPNINAPSGGILSGTCVDAPVDSICNLQCTGNTRPVGATSARCVADQGSRVGRWDRPLGICQSVNCPNLPFPPDGSTNGQCTAASPGSICDFTCRPGFTLIGNARLQCLDTGIWNSNVPSCKVNTCPNLGSPQNGAASGTCSNAIPGNKCSFQCNAGFQLNGISALTCQNDGQWTGPPPICSQIFCDDLIAPYQGSTNGNCTKATPGQLCNFYCNFGYRLTGSPVLSCNVNGKWSTTSPTCERIICPSLTSPVGGRFSGKCLNASPNDVCNFSCLPGYTPSVSQPITCQSDGTWSGQPSLCQEFLCANLLPPQGGSMSGKCINGTFGAVCNFTCNPGFRLLGADSITCQSSGLWTGNPPICKRITCPNLYAPSQGSTLGDCVNAGSGSTCEFICSPGNVLVGNQILTCNPDGTWNYKTPTCNQVICPIIYATPGSVISGSCSNATPNQACYYSCLTGYRQVGENLAVCQNNGTWTTGPPVCEQILCPDLQALNNGQSSGMCQRATYGSMCNFSCAAGFTLSGVQSVVCQSDGKWTGSLPVCQRIVCPNLYPPSQGSTNENCINATPGAICQFYCSIGYKLEGSPSLTCNTNGSWNGVTPICARNMCPVLKAPVDGTVSDSCANANPDQFCYFTCNTGFKLLGAPSSLCQTNGVWTTPPPTCQKILCPNLTEPQYGSVTGSCTSAEVNQFCNFRCNEGFRLEGQNVLKCQSTGTWTSNPPVCQPNLCPDLLAPNNGGTSGSCSQSPIGSKCTFFCAAGYILTGNSPLTCTGPDGVWDGNAPTCSRVRCPNLAAPQGGSSSGSCTNATPTSLCAFYCSTGFRLVGNNVTTCQDDGTWSNPIPQCQRVVCTPDLVAPQGGTTSGICTSATTGDQCNFACGVGYRILGVNRLTCQNDGQWTGVAPVCEAIMCNDLVAPFEGMVTGNCVAATPGSICSFSCNKGSTLNGSPQLICTNTGNWNGPTPTCSRVICPPLRAPQSGSSSGRCSNASPPDVCQFYCPVGQTLVGGPSSTCLDNGSWSSPTPSCQRNVCPPLPPPDNGVATGTCTNAFYNDGCQFNCSAGYLLTGSSWISCLANGSWALPIATCERILCQSLSTPPNAQASGVCTNAGVGSQCTYTCNQGYIPSNPMTLICTESGFWNGQQPICQRILCPNLAQPQNGGLSGTCSSATPGQQCQFSCGEGYQLVGSPVSNCQDNGAWSNPTPTCARIICTELLPPVNGNQAGQCSNANPGGTCQFSCQNGFLLFGSPSSTCQNDGTYTTPTPTCQQILCPALSSPVNGNNSGTCTNAAPGQACQFTCQTGYRLFGSSVSNCQPSGTWTSPTPSCQRIICPDLPPPVNGNGAGVCAGAAPGDVCQFSCQPGYIVNGIPSATCQPNGTWSNQSPSCQQILCPTLNPPINGNSAGTCSNATPGQVCQFSCQPGYFLTGRPVSNCQPTGTWSSPTPTCEKITCPNLPPPVNGNESGVCMQASPGDVCQFFCNTGYLLNGNPSASCQPGGTWSNPTPSCQQVLCPNRGPPINGNIAGTCSNATPGQVCQFSCQPGYLLTGSAVSNCQPTGTWSSPIPACQKITCPDLQPPINGNESGVCSTASPGDVCQFSCNTGYLLNGNPSTSCQPDGTWSNQQPTCQQIVCPNLPIPTNGNNAGTCSNATPGQVCQFSCQPGYLLTGSPVSNCQPTGTWSSPTPTCQKINCPDLPPPINGDENGVCSIASPGDVCQFSCNTGYLLNGNPSASCQADGSWSNQSPTCQQLACPYIEAPQNGISSGSCQNAPVGSQCSFTCDNGYQLLGNPQISCQVDGTWTTTPPVCQQNICPTLVPPISGSVTGTCQSATPNSQCTFSCNAGFRIQGTSPLTCQIDGKWNTNPPTCAEIMCPNLQPNSDSRITGKCQQAVPTDTCTFSCNQGFQSNGNANFVCQADGSWSPIGNPPTCSLISCPTLNNPNNGMATGVCASATVNSACRFQCNNGYQLVGSSTLLCYDTGTWSGQPPTCERVSCPDLVSPKDGVSSGVCNQASSGSSCTFACNPGYYLQGQSTLTCTDRGNWNNPTPICLPISCPDLQTPLNGNSNGVCMNAKAYDQCTFTCAQGYNLEGVNSLTCQIDSKWTGLAPRCIRVTCPDLNVPQFGTTTGTCIQAAQGSVCNYACNNGYLLQGVKSLTCQPTGQWNGNPPSCKLLQCPDLRAPVEGRVQGICTQASPGAVCSFSCNPCYRLRGESTLSCSTDGQWSGGSPICEVIMCPILVPPQSASFTGVCTQASPGNICKINCSAATRLRGSNSITCQANGTWSDQLPNCGAITCPNLVVPSGGLQSGSCVQAIPGSICSFSCNTGNTIKGPNSLTCGPDGLWSGQPPSCTTVVCPDILPPANGQSTGPCRGSISGNQCQFTCNAGFQLNGSPAITCRPDGTWDSNAPTCSALYCPLLSSGPGGTASGICSLAVNGNKCNFNCDAGYQLVGGSSLTCLPTGQWDKPVPNCVGTNCPDLSAPIGGTTSGSCTGALPLGICNFQCNGELVLSGSPSLTCQSTGKWNSGPPSCSATPRCPDLLAPAGGSISGQCTAAVVNAICTYVCTEGRDLRGFNQLTCRSDGTWSSDPPTCEAPQCPALPIPQNGLSSGSCTGASAGQSCQFICNPGYLLNGQPTLTCQAQGRWDNAAPICQQPGVSCPTIDVVNAVESGACTNAEPGRVCEIGCNEGFRVNGPSKLICLSTGSWDINFPICVAVTCPAIAAPENGGTSGSCATATFNQRCDFKCNTGYSVEGPRFITCLSDGNWNESPPSCPQMTCAELANPQYGAISGICAAAVGGDKCDFSCENAFLLRGSNSLTCRPDGNWDSSPPTCLRIVCPIKSAIPNGRATGICQDATVEQICSYECNQGFKLQGNKDLTCTTQGQWDTESPTCVIIKCPALSFPNNGRMTGSCSESFPADECNFACNNDYNLSGTPKLICQADGSWSSTAPTCEVQVKCPNLQDPIGGNTRGSCTRADPGRTCLFTCDAGYTIDGDESLTCQDSGEWSAQPPRCIQIRCSALTKPENGQTSGVCSNRAIYGDECRFACSRGYGLNGRSTARCTLTGEWTEEVPTCEPNTCGPISIPQTGTGSDGCNTGIFNDRCTITCNNGYRLIGTAVLTCTAEGYWSANPPTCELQTCRSLTLPPNGRMTGRCSPGNAFQDCKFECNIGYKLQGTATLTCDPTGRWTGAEPTCLQIQCPSLQPVPNSATNGQCSPGLPGAACRYVCRRGFKLQGPPTITCTAAGTWETQPPTCDPLACPDLTAPAQGSMSGVCTGATLDSRCTFKCNTGYTLEGRPLLTCQTDEQWNELTPSCVLNACDALTPPDDGAMTGDCAPGVPGKLCTFTCNTNFKLVGRAILACKNDGSWNYSPPQCSQVTCPGLRAPGNGSMDGVCEPNGIAPDTCSFSCAPGFNLVGSETLTCGANGRWDGRPPRCVAITCSNLFPPSGASITGQCSRATPGQRCVFTCINLNTRLVGNDNLICNDDGTWSSDAPTCEAILCPDVQQAENLQQSGVCRNARPNDVCRFSCLPGSNLAGTSSITCNRDGTWSGTPPTCTAVTCRSLSPPANGAQEGDCAPGVPSQTCTVTCNEGFNPLSVIYTCQNDGRWNPVPPSPLRCSSTPEPVTQAPDPNPICSRLIRPPNGRIDRCDLYVRGQCIFTCNNGYVIYGGPVRTCQPNGRWDGLAPTCIKRTVVIPNGSYQQRRSN